MKKLVVFYSRANENYFGGQCKYIDIGNTEKIADIIAELTGADLFKLGQKVWAKVRIHSLIYFR